MSSETRDDLLTVVSEELLSISPLISRLIRRKLIQTAAGSLDLNITPLHFEIMRILEEKGTLHVSEIGEKLHIARAQMTKLIDKLVAMGLVERDVDASDRRTLNITLTGQARIFLKENKDIIMKAVQEIVSSLTEEDLVNLSASLRSLRDILLKSQKTISRAALPE